MFLSDDVVRIIKTQLCKGVTSLIRGALQRDIPITTTLKAKKANNTGKT